MPANPEAKDKVDRNFLSPLFVKVANLHYLSEEYEDCISVCRAGLSVYPNYLTAKLLLLRAFLKAEYLNEAEALFSEIKPKVTSNQLLTKLRNNIDSLASVSNQEKLYMPSEAPLRAEFSEFDRNFEIQEKLFPEFDLESILEGSIDDAPASVDPDYEDFMLAYETFHFNIRQQKGDTGSQQDVQKSTAAIPAGDTLMSKVRIITETLADLYAEQGNYKEAMEAYNLLLRAGSTNYKRIEEKLLELERKIQ